MQKIYIVRWTEEERNGLQGIIKKLKCWWVARGDG